MSIPAARRALRIAASAAVLVLAASTALLAAPPERLSQDLKAALERGSADRFDVIVQGSAAEVDAAASRYGELKKRLRTGAVLGVSRAALAAMAGDASLGHVAGDAPVQSMMAVENEAVGADQVQAGAIAGVQALTGRGVGVALLDSGVSAHAALRGQVTAAFNFTGPAGRGEDGYGHGTHVAGIIAGRGEGFSGVAPGASLVSLKVLDDNGAGRTSDVIAALDWAVEHKAEYRLRVVNLSLGHPVFDSYVDDPLCQAVERAVRAGLVVVASAGNFGKLPDGRRVIGGVGSPGNSPYSLTVGALDTRGTGNRGDDVVPDWSSLGPTYLNSLLKPDLVAPGVNVESLYAPGSTLARTYPERLVSGNGQNGLFRLSGSSMATAMVSGAVAAVLEANPGLGPADVRVALQSSASFLPDAGLMGAGAGSLNLAAAVQVAKYRAEPGHGQLLHRRRTGGAERNHLGAGGRSRLG